MLTPGDPQRYGALLFPWHHRQLRWSRLPGQRRRAFPVHRGPVAAHGAKRASKSDRAVEALVVAGVVGGQERLFAKVAEVGRSLTSGADVEQWTDGEPGHWVKQIVESSGCFFWIPHPGCLQ